jgi:selenocysteine lyase/cysteine desulfurase
MRCLSAKERTAMPFDIDRARADTPGVRQRIHFNNAGAALMPVQVLHTMQAHLWREAEIGGYEAKEAAEDALGGTYRSIAQLLNCAPDEIAVVENATRAWDMAFYAFDFKPGDRILTAVAEYASNYLAYLQVCRRTGARVEVVPDDAAGQLDVAELERRVDRGGPVKLITVTHVPSNGSLVNPAAEIGRVARTRGIPYLLDACQSVGQMPIDVQATQVDLLSTTGRKFLRGPRGIGFLYVRREWIERLVPPFLDLHAAEWTAADNYVIRADARRFENWESNIAAKLGLGVAVDYALSWGLEAIQERVTELAGALRKALAGVPGVAVRDRGSQQCGIVSFTASPPSGVIRDALLRRGINVHVSDAASTRLDMDGRGLIDLVRTSVHYYNTHEEIERFVAELAKIVNA